MKEAGVSLSWEHRRRPLSGPNHKNLVLGSKVRKNVPHFPLLVSAEQNKCSTSREGSIMNKSIGAERGKKRGETLYGFRDFAN